MVITLMPGEVLSVEFFESNEPRALVVKYDVSTRQVDIGDDMIQTFTEQSIQVDTEWPDDTNRSGTIYSSVSV